MKETARIQEVIALLESYTFSKPVDEFLHGALRFKRYIGSSDRRAIRDLFYKILRKQVLFEAQLDLLSQKGLVPRDLMEKARWLLILYFLWERRDQGMSLDVDALFSGHTHAPASLSTKERKMLTLDLSLVDEAASLSLPLFWYEKLKEKVGARIKEAAEALDEEAPLDLRVNTLKMTRDESLAFLKLHGVEADPLPYAPHGVRIRDKKAFKATHVVTEGYFEPQDEGSQLISALCDVKPGMRVMDFCAGAGGKTLSLAMAMENRGTIIASDIAQYRLDRARIRFQRLGVHNVTLKVIDSQWIKKHAHTFDCVLVDAPCSGSGTWRRNPDLKMRMGEKDVKELLEKQSAILASASRLVRPGGRLVYATCSFLKEENEDQIQTFLAHYKDFSLLRGEVTEEMMARLSQNLPQRDNSMEEIVTRLPQPVSHQDHGAGGEGKGVNGLSHDQGALVSSPSVYESTHLSHEESLTSSADSASCGLENLSCEGSLTSPAFACGTEQLSSHSGEKETTPGSAGKRMDSTLSQGALEGSFSLTPWDHGTDGFFMAVMVKV